MAGATVWGASKLPGVKPNAGNVGPVDEGLSCPDETISEAPHTAQS